MIGASLIERARAVPIEGELVRRNIKLRGGVERWGPCPRCGGVDRFSINRRKQVFNCRGCRQGGDIIALVQHLDGCSFGGAIELLTGESFERRAKPNPARITDDGRDYETAQARKAAWLWSRRLPIKGSPAEAYLREARGYKGLLPATLGFLAPGRPGHHPAMIAAFGVPDEPEPGIIGTPHTANAVHLTLLRPDGSGKAEPERPKLVVGRPLGRPIVLAVPNDLLGLAITEGIEDALSVHEATGLGAWAAGAAGFMPALANAVPDYIEAVTVYAHDDDGGQRNAAELAQQIAGRGVETFIEGDLS
jgi:hypothetical protein